MQVAENHEPRSRRELALQFSQAQPETLLRTAFEAAYFRPYVIENSQ
jgi:hypothetical protein